MNRSPSQFISLFFLPWKPLHLKSFSYNLSKKSTVREIIENQYQFNFLQSEIHKSYEIFIELINNLVTRQELYNRLLNFRGDDPEEVANALTTIGIIITLIKNQFVLSFNLNGNAIISPHLQWLYVNYYQPGQFGYGKGVVPRTVTGMTQNAGSDKKYPSSGSWDYVDVMRELDK